jgi:hypothetical protein
MNVPGCRAVNAYRNRPPGGTIGCEIPATPSIASGSPWIPCRWIVSGTLIALRKSITTRSPSRTTSVGPGTTPSYVFAITVSPGCSVHGASRATSVNVAVPPCRTGAAA